MRNGMEDRILEVLSNEERTFRPIEIARELGTTKTAIAPIVKALEESGQIVSAGKTSGRRYTLRNSGIPQGPPLDKCYTRLILEYLNDGDTKMQKLMEIEKERKCG